MTAIADIEKVGKNSTSGHYKRQLVLEGQPQDLYNQDPLGSGPLRKVYKSTKILQKPSTQQQDSYRIGPCFKYFAGITLAFGLRWHPRSTPQDWLPQKLHLTGFTDWTCTIHVHRHNLREVLAASPS